MRCYSILVVALFGSSCLAAALPEPLLEDRGSLTNGQCKRDTCLGALAGQQGTTASADCVSFRRTTVTPPASTTTKTTYTTVVSKDKTVTKTVTNFRTTTTTSLTTTVSETDVTSTTTATVTTATVTQKSPYRNKRLVGKQQGGIPNYAAGPCKSAAQYTSACDCIHATRQTTTAARPTVTQYTTKTRLECATVTVQKAVDETVTVTTASTITSISTSTATATAFATATTTVSPTYPGPVFKLQDMYNADKKIYAAAGPGHFGLLVGPSPATPFYLDTNSFLHSVLNVGQSVGYCPNTDPNTGGTNIFTYPVSESPCQQNGSPVPLLCHLYGDTTLGSSGPANCTIPGFAYLAGCGGNLITYAQAPIVSNTTNTTNATGGCSDLYHLNLKYTIIDPDQPLSRRHEAVPDADYAPPQRRRKSRPEMEAPKMVYERESASE